MKLSKVVPINRNVTREPRTDGWHNLVTLLGTSGDKRMASELNWENHPPEFYEQLYAGGGMPARIVDIVPQHCLRNWVNWLNLEGSKKDKQYAKDAIEERCEEIDLRNKFSCTWSWARAYGGGGLYVVTDTSDPSSPLQRGEKVLALRDLSRWDLRILTTDVEYDMGNVNYGRPRIYYLNVQMGSQYKGYPIHWTRIIRFDGQLVPRRTYIRNNYWHDSILQRTYNAIRNYEVSNDTVATMLADFNVDVYKMNNLANLIGAGKENIVKNRIEMMNYTKSTINAMILDTKDEDYESKQKSVEGIADLLRMQANRLVADTDVPHTVLLGESPDGSNATGNSTSQNWYNFLKAEQTHYAKPKLNALVDVVFPEQPKLRPGFRPLRVLDEMENAEVRNKNAQTDGLYIEKGVLDPTEVTDSRFGGDEYGQEIELDDEGRENGTIVPGAQDFANPDDEDDGEDPESTTGDEPPEGKGKKGQPPSEPETKGNQPRKPKKNSDITGKGRSDASAELSVESGAESRDFAPRNAEIKMKAAEPKDKAFISQTMSEPFRNPATDPLIKGPGIPNKARTILPTLGNGITAPSGQAAGTGKPDPEATDSLAIERNPTKENQNRKKAYDSDNPSKRVAQVIVRDGDNFLMGKRKDKKWAFPGGHVEDGESHHQGALRELAEETGIGAKKLKFLGGRMVEPKKGTNVHINLYQHHVVEGQKTTTKLDPDKEFTSLKWFSRKEPLPDDVKNNLAHPNNVALQHLGLLE